MSRGSLGFGIVRSLEVVRGRVRFAELCGIMSEALGVLVVPHHPATYAELVRGCERGDLGLAWLPPVLSAKLAGSGRAKVVALPVRRGAVSYQSAIIGRVGGPASIRELGGARVAWVDRESSSGYIVPRLFLEAERLDVGRLFKTERFVETHGAVVDAVASGRADVGATYCATAGGAGGARPKAASEVRGPWTGAGPAGGSQEASPIVVLATTGSIPNDAIVASAAVASDLRTSIARWLLSPHEGRVDALCKELFDADSFRVASDAHFAPLRSMLTAAGAAKGAG